MLWDGNKDSVCLRTYHYECKIQIITALAIYTFLIIQNHHPICSKPKSIFLCYTIFLQFDIVLVYKLHSKICLMKAIKHVIKYCIIPFREHKYLDRSAIRTNNTFFLLKTINAIFCNANRGVLHVNFSALIQTKSIIRYRIALVMLD